MNFNKEQLQAINSDGNIVVMASAGSGKTSTIIARTNRLVEDGVNPESILLITFSRKAKDTLIERLKYPAVNVETFHSFALKIIKDKYGEKYDIWLKKWEKEKVIQDLLKDLELFDAEEPNKYISDCMDFIANQKHKMIYPDQKLDFNGFEDLQEEEYRKIYVGYEAYRFKHNLIEFDDFLNIAYNIFTSDERLLNIYRNKYKYVMADEFQDVSVAQALVLMLLNDKETMIVGDPLQAIYAFRGGNSKYILDFDKDYKDTTVVNLNTNYRCKDTIVSLSNSFAKEWIPDTKHRNYVESRASRENGEAPTLQSYYSDMDESESIAKEIKKSGLKYKNFAVLSRTNAQLQSMQNAFGTAEIPFQVYGGCLYTEQAEIKLLLSYLRLATDTNDNAAFEYLYNKPNRWLGKAFLDEVHKNNYGIGHYHSMDTIKRRQWKFKRGIEEIQEVIEKLQDDEWQNVGQMVKYLRKRLPIDDFFNKDNEDGEYNEHTESMNTFQKMCYRFDTVEKLMNYLSMLTNEQSDESVKLLTIHKSKGMEFPIVYLIGLDDRHMPHYANCNVDDEARVMYVGMTRAADELHMSYSGTVPSRFFGKKKN